MYCYCVQNNCQLWRVGIVSGKVLVVTRFHIRWCGKYDVGFAKKITVSDVSVASNGIDIRIPSAIVTASVSREATGRATATIAHFGTIRGQDLYFRQGRIAYTVVAWRD